MIRTCFFLCALTFSVTFFSFDALAQYKGGYDPNAVRQEEDRAAKPIPRKFSSRLASAQQSERLDILLHNLYVSFWNYAVTDMTYQNQLYTLVRPERFQTTRYMREFRGTMTGAMNNLNSNYKGLTADIEEANVEYIMLREGLLTEDLELADEIWTEEIERFESTSMDFFKMQNNFLNTYGELVKFIIDQGGSYAYSGHSGITFFNLGSYRYFGTKIDQLRKITFNQKKLVRENAPANVDLSVLR